MAKETTGFSLSDELLTEIDKRRGQVSRSAFAEEAMRRGLNMSSYIKHKGKHRKL